MRTVVSLTALFIVVSHEYVVTHIAHVVFVWWKSRLILVVGQHLLSHSTLPPHHYHGTPIDGTRLSVMLASISVSLLVVTDFLTYFLLLPTEHRPQWASCLINARPFRHSPAADDNSLIGCTSHDLTGDWSLASTHFVDSHYPFRGLFGCALLLNRMFWKQCTVRQYHSTLSDQFALEVRVRNLG